MITVTRYTASWCGPCKVYGPIFEEVSLMFSNVKFESVFHEDDECKFAEAGVTGVPMTIATKDGKFLAAETGAMTKAKLVEFINIALSR